MNRRPDVAAYALVALLVACTTALRALGFDEPDWFSLVAATAVGGGAGVAVAARAPRRADDTTPTPRRKAGS